ncbi:hypothetical protein GLOTRDRAFT_111935, partial [Gloeophyllum trabeum ATCC 11539]
ARRNSVRRVLISSYVRRAIFHPSQAPARTYSTAHCTPRAPSPRSQRLYQRLGIPIGRYPTDTS